MSNIVYPAQYYNRALDDGAGSDEITKGYDELLFRAGYVDQASEYNELQTLLKHRIKKLGDHLLKDGDIKSGGNLIISPGATAATVSVLCEASEVWLSGGVRDVPQATLIVPSAGQYQVGVYLTTAVVDETQDATLRDPARGLRLVGEAGAARLRVTAQWGYAGDNQTGDFWTLFRILNGAQQLRSAPPEANTVAQAISRYDRQSTGGTYVSSGFRVQMIDTDNEGYQEYSLSSGEARVTGVEIATDYVQTISFTPVADTDTVDLELYDSTGSSGQVVTVRHWPISVLTRVLIDKQVTAESVTRSALGATDNLAHTSIRSVSLVNQGGTNYVLNTDYSVVNDQISWINGQAHPNPGTTYTVTYIYAKSVTSTATVTADGTGITIPETNVSGSGRIDVAYSYKLPRVDRICLDSTGQWVILTGTSSRTRPSYPVVPPNMVGLASIYQSWVPGTRKVVNDSPRMVSMATLESMNSRLDALYQIVAGIEPKAELTAREPLGRRGIFADPLTSDSMRDPGATQTAQITRIQTMTLGVEVVEIRINLDAPLTLTQTDESTLIDQPLSSDSKQINPYLVFAPFPAYCDLVPWQDFWTENRTKVLPVQYVDVYTLIDDPSYLNVLAWAYKNGLVPGTPQWNAHMKNHHVRTTITSVTETSSVSDFTSQTDAPFLRNIDVNFTLTHWGTNENMVDVKIAGRSVNFVSRP